MNNLINNVEQHKLLTKGLLTDNLSESDLSIMVIIINY